MASQSNTMVLLSPTVDAQRLTLGDRFFWGSLSLLSAIPNTKIGLIEPIEIVFLLHLAYLLFSFSAGGFRARFSRVWVYYGLPHLAFFAAAFVLALFALRQSFFPIPEEGSLLKQPLYISLARLVEYFLVAFYMLYAAVRLRKRQEALTFALRVYVFAGVAGSIYGFVCLPIVMATDVKYLGVQDHNYRLCGTFNEGGPYGLYLVSVLLCMFLLYARKELKVRSLIPQCVVVVTAVIFTESKAAFAAIAIMLLMTVLFGKSFRLKLATLVCLAALVAGVIATPRIYLGLMVYVTAATDSTTGLADDSAFGFSGRAAAAVLVPRMIAAHPLAGIGIGNYQIVRNDPAYLQGITPLTHWDYSGAGFFVKIAELGIPLSLFLLGVLLLPLRTAIKMHANMLLKVFASFQLIATFQGVELHFYYPWLCSAFVLAALFFTPKSAFGPSAWKKAS